MRFHCLQHVSFEAPGLIANWIGEQGYTLSFTRLFQNEPLPDVHAFDALVIMGGPMSIHDEAELPWLKNEKELITNAIREKKKVLGICLGAQLIASASGARVYPNSQKEIGFLSLHWTAAARNWLSPSFRPGQVRKSSPQEQQWPESSLLFHWHGETFDLPEGAVHLAFTKACPNQAFLLGETTLGLQFHPELTPAIVREMIAHEGHELAPANTPGASFVCRETESGEYLRLLQTSDDGPSANTLGASFVQSEADILQQLTSLEGNEKLLYPLLERFFNG